jgi:hypothetical protein
MTPAKHSAAPAYDPSPAGVTAGPQSGKCTVAVGVIKHCLGSGCERVCALPGAVIAAPGCVVVVEVGRVDAGGE